MWRTFVSVLITCLIAMLLAGLGVIWVFYHFGGDLPDYKQLVNYEPPVVSRLYAADGRLFAEYALERRVFVPMEAMPRRIVRTFLAAEDKNFYAHPGLDFLGIVRAAVSNVANLGRKAPMGASTITQQVAKNFFLSNERSFSRKAKEAVLALRIESTLTKDRIMELYLNQIYLGQGSYGVAAAALNYFNKSMDELNIEEAAYLAALPKAPNNYHPHRAPKAALGRRNYVINRMVEDGVVSAKEGEEAKTRPIVLRPHHEANVIQADFFAEEVRRELVARYGQDSLYQGGLVVRTTLSPTYQVAVDRALRQGILDYDKRHGWRGPIAHLEEKSSQKDWQDALEQLAPPKGLAPWVLAVVTVVTEKKADILTTHKRVGHITLEDLAWARPCLKDQKIGSNVKSVKDVLKVGDVIAVEKTKGQSDVFSLRQIPKVGGAMMVLDPHTGRVLAMSGGYSFAQSEFNRATQANRQPGSSFKPFVYLAAFEAGRGPQTIVMDAPISIDLGPNLPVWTPNNISKKFYGPITLRTALENSYNISTIRVAQDIGMKRVIDVSQRLGVVDHMPLQLAMVLGAGETTVKKMAAAYSVFVNGGKKITPAFIDRIQDRQGRTLYRHDNRPCLSCANQVWPKTERPILSDEREPLVHPIHAYQVLSVLEGVIKRGTGRKLANFGRPLAGKTGSTNEFRDGWFVGMTPDLVTVVYIGFDDHRTLGQGEVGGRVALNIFQYFAEDILKHEAPIPFRVPSGARLMRINHKTGEITSARDPDAVLEAFIPGTEPKPGQHAEPISQNAPQTAAQESDQPFSSVLSSVLAPAPEGSQTTPQEAISGAMPSDQEEGETPVVTPAPVDQSAPTPSPSEHLGDSAPGADQIY